MKVLVTGGAGFIGSHIVDLLIQNGIEVCIVDNLITGNVKNINSKAKFYNVDIRDPELINIFKQEMPQYVIHEAAQINVVNSIKNPIEDASINILGTINILECCRRVGVKKVIYPASAAVFGEPKYLPVDENHPLNMISQYGVSKHTVEHYLDVYYRLYGIEYNIFRYSNVYGPRQDSSGEGGVVAIFMDNILKEKQSYIYGDGNQTRDFVYVKDIARANLMAINYTIPNGIYNICNNNQISINELFSIMTNILRKSKLKPIYKKSRDGDIRNSYMIYKKIYDKIGWHPQYDIISGLEDFVKSIQ
ncbi:UDP-glucose 4-epimerase [Clostridium novyi A str. 4552]|uniref:UDP-glucose 4-epimerase n=1 Tax=Clostridium novyi A str. 4552 TaxID=1444289 RepID=A0A0A0I7S2_CLONO|nr:NAD-dependent epimerase/dehydratase family protein [Clostridium novyi]KGM97504.1 UDP-glucose 4-epimerase [Clostridium novyi A str. 4552]